MRNRTITTALVALALAACFSVAKQHPEVSAEFGRIAAAHRQTITPVKSQLDERLPAETTNKERQ